MALTRSGKLIDRRCTLYRNATSLSIIHLGVLQLRHRELHFPATLTGKSTSPCGDFDNSLLQPAPSTSNTGPDLMASVDHTVTRQWSRVADNHHHDTALL
jgi:hypothetical protein